MILGLIIWLCIGAFVGWLASVLMNTDGEMGLGMNIVIGIVGAFIGGFVMRALGANGTNVNEHISFYSIIVSVIGAVILLGIVKLVRRGRLSH